MNAPRSEGPRNRLAVVRSQPPAKQSVLGLPLRLITSSDDREFLPAALEILETPASPRRLAFIWIVCLILGAALIWSCVAKLDIYAVAPGRIQPSGRSKVIQSFEPGKVKVIAVANGARVNAGDTLLELDPTDAYADRDSAAGDLEAGNAEIARREAEITAVLSGNMTAPEIAFPATVGKAARSRERNVMMAEIAQYSSSRDALQAQLEQNLATKQKLTASIAQRLKLIAIEQKRLDMRKQLNQLQVGSLMNVLDAQQQLENELTSLATDKGSLLEATAAAVATERKIEQLQKQFVADQAGKLGDAVKKRDQNEQVAIKTQAKAERTRLAAPVSGIVQQLAVTTIGQVVTSGQSLLVIVPQNGPIDIEALVPNSDFGFVTLGQEAVVKIDAFPFSRYGTIDGKVIRVSHDSVYDKDVAASDASTPQAENQSTLSSTPKTQGLVYPVTVELARSDMLLDGKAVALVPGMSATVEIRTGERRVIDYLLSPLREIVSQAGHER